MADLWSSPDGAEDIRYFEHNQSLRVVVMAESKERAVKVAMEQRAVHIANGGAA